MTIADRLTSTDEAAEARRNDAEREIFPASSGMDHSVADLSLADAGRRQIELAEHEMPGLMELRRRYRAERPLAGARVTGSLHMTVQTAVLIETLIDLGAEVRWASCNIFSTQDEAAAAVVVGPPESGGSAADPKGVPVFAWKGETLPEYWWCTLRALDWPNANGPTLIVDDGGDATLLIHRGVEYERDGAVPDFDPETEPEEWGVILDLIRRVRSWDGNYFTRMAGGLRGISEETTTGVHRLYELQEEGALLCPAVNVNDSVTKSKFDNVYGCRHSLIDGLNRATDLMIGGKSAVVCGYGEVGKGCAQSLRGQGCRVIVTEIDPICALQASMEGYQVARIEDVVETADIFVTCTGNKSVVTAELMSRMKNKAVVGNIGHFDNEIDIAGLKRIPGIRSRNIKDQVDEWIFPDGRSLLILAEGRLLNLGCATGHPSFVMSTSFANQVLAQIDLHRGGDERERKVTLLPRHLDEEVARLHLDHLGARLTELTEEQAAYIGVPAAGPYKRDDYRY